jgi:5'-deoxynucleotidase YfbR-like HD superfamily hydrolase
MTHNIEIKSLHSRSWQRMLSGKRLDLLNPSPNDIEIEDLIHGLSVVPRWNGQTIGDHIYSVAQHTLLVLEIFDRLNPGSSPKTRLAVLLHDSPEYVIGDLITQFKRSVGPKYKELENSLLDAIHQRFDLDVLSEKTAVLIKEADKIAAYFEATCLNGFSCLEAGIFFGYPDLNKKDFEKLLTPWPTKKVREKYGCVLRATIKDISTPIDTKMAV